MANVKVRLLSPAPEEKAIPRWKDFSLFAEKGIGKRGIWGELDIVRKPDDAIMVFTAGGTTAKPKAVPTPTRASQLSCKEATSVWISNLRLGYPAATSLSRTSSA